jgi:dTDP-4-amino-4,6-dideoxygalactose transaminase
MSVEEIPLFKVLMAPEAHQEISAVMRSGHIAQGQIVEDFEQRLNLALELDKRQQALTVNSGTSALHLALHLAGVGPGDIVAVSPMTCAATIIPILHLKARPLWIDVDPITGLMNPLDLRAKLAAFSLPHDSVKAVVAVDWAGTPCNYPAIRAAIRESGIRSQLSIVEDAAHAFGAKNEHGTSIGLAPYIDNSIDHYVCWSTQAIKHLTTGDGGILLAPPYQTERARKLRWFGLDRRSKTDFRAGQQIEEAGYKFHMNDLSAAIGNGNLKRAVRAVSEHQANASFYHHMFKDLKRIHVPPWHGGSSYWIYTILVDDRDSFVEFMKLRRIATSQVHRRCDEHPAFVRDDACSRAAGTWASQGLDFFSKHQVSIPCGWWLSPSEVGYIAETVIKWANS